MRSFFLLLPMLLCVCIRRGLFFIIMQNAKNYKFVFQLKLIDSYSYSHWVMRITAKNVVVHDDESSVIKRKKRQSKKIESRKYMRSNKESWSV